MWVRLLSLFVLPSWSWMIQPCWDPEQTSQAGACLCTTAFTHLLSFPLPPKDMHTHTCHTWDKQDYVFSESPIFSSHELTTGGTWCYINAQCFSLSLLLVLWVLPLTYVPIDSHLLECKGPANQTWPSGYQHGYDVSVVWYVGWLSVLQHTHTRVLWQCLASRLWLCKTSIHP